MSNGQPDKEVTITLNGSGLPVPNIDPVEVKKDNQKVRWCADFPFIIRFDGGAGTFTSSPNGSDCANRAQSGTFSEIKKYNYTIIANNQENDPEVDVKP